MKIPIYFSFFTLILSSLSYAQIESKSGEFNISSPLEDGVYVAGQKLPITYVITDSGSSVNYTSLVIAQKADVFEKTGAVVTINGKSYWQHTYNYEIPSNAPAGYYQVVFESVDTNINTTVPVNIRPFVNITSTTPANSSPSQTSSVTTGLSDSKKSMASTNSVYLTNVISFLLLALAVHYFN
ncbi:hypothetical protein BJ944DRAFT_246697 [Cunninghamella echinulata]|nr:hypothetical protein BJ944DRAFT_246697 [Cunninghamella echinulata]